MMELPPCWQAALAAETDRPEWSDLMKFVAAERAAHPVMPDETDVFNAFHLTPLDQVKVLILGQDPYPTPGVAHGLSFSVRPGTRVPASLRNIYKELRDDLGIEPPNHGCLEAWAKRGVLLLNTCLTVRAGAANSHSNKGWERFTDAAISAVNRRPGPVVFLLWGTAARKKAALIDTAKHTIIEGVHPSPLSARSGFYGSKPFSKANACLQAAGQPPIDWSLPSA